MSAERVTDDPKVAVGYETTDVDVRPVAIAFTSVMVAAVVIAGLMVALLGFFLSQISVQSPSANPLAGAYGRRMPPAPRLQTDAIADLDALRAEESRTLGTYGWIDRNSGIAHIPIDRAMALVVERGLPVRTGASRPEGAR